MKIIIEELKLEDAESLFNFEVENRSFFEEMVPGRGEAYYEYTNFQKIHQSLLEEQQSGLSCFYLIKDDSTNSIIGRINLIDIDSEGVGHLGYRVGKRFIRKGVAKAAVKLLLEKVIEEGTVKEIQAKTTSNNISSQKVLEHNGFQHNRISDEIGDSNNEQFHFVHYKWMAKLDNASG